MKKPMTMQKQITFLFICLITLPTLTIYLFTSFIFKSSTTKDLQTIYQTNVQEMGRTLDTIFDQALEFSSYPLTEMPIYAFMTASSETSNYAQLKQEAQNCMEYIYYGYKSSIQDMGICTEYGDSVMSNNLVSLSDQDIYNLQKTTDGIYWDFSSCVASLDYIYLLRHLQTPPNSPDYMGYIKLSIARSELKTAMRHSELNNQTSYFVVTPYSQVLVYLDSAHFLYYGNTIQTYSGLQEHLSHGELSWLENGRIVSVYALKNGLLLYSISQPQILSTVHQSFLLTISIMAILVIVISALLSIYFSKIITAPLNKLGKHMTDISQENFSVRADVQGCYEIIVLTKLFNQMAERLEFLYNEVYIGEVKLKQAQLDMLQTQLNPHFLYNTLDTIYWMVRMKETEQAGVMVSSLSRMMRLTLTPKIDNKIPLKQELEHLSCYISIQEIRYGKKVRFEMNCPENLNHLMVLNLLLQPLVENALVHGLSNSLNGIVRIQIYQESQMLVYEVSNNGVPIDEDEIHHILTCRDQSLKGFALRNLSDRIQLKYGKSYHLSCYKEQEFSVFRIVQPIEERKNYDKDTFS